MHTLRGKNTIRLENYFRKSLEIVPKVQECSVRINLALSIETQSDREVDLKHYDIATEKIR